MDADYARSYRELYQHHWWWRAREALLMDTIRELLPAGRRHRILDVGCGSGLFFDRLDEFGHVEGVETDAALAAAESRHRERIHVGDLLSFRADEPYDLVLMLDVLEHMDNAQAVFRRALTMLAPGGRVLVTVPAFLALWTHHDELNQHVTRYTRLSLRTLVEGAGGRIERSHYFFAWTVPVKLLVRAAERLRGPSAPAKVPPRPVNRVLYSLSRAEHFLFRRLKPPAGSSLLGVCSAAGTT